MQKIAIIRQPSDIFSDNDQQTAKSADIPEYYPEQGFFGVGFRNKWKKLKQPHIHTGLEIGMILSGRGCMYLNGEHFPLNEGDLYSTDAMIPHGHETVIDAPLQFIFAYLNAGSILSLDPHSRDILLFQPFVAVHSGMAPVVEGTKKAQVCLETALKEFQSDSQFAAVRAWSHILPVVILIAEKVYSRIRKNIDNGWVKKNRMLTDAISYIRGNFRRKLTIKEIAGMCNCSESTLSHTFSQSTGSSPIDYRNTLRIGHAIELLFSTDLPLVRVADECGFNSYSQFREIFKRMTGKPPGEFRESDK
ncbi:MAG: helix-turn-helix domain-containing protein [Chitinivibrionales bacterium]|nr:helix-turn-helix domain-containing protein [Chitinivibrionales bacterium]